MPLSAIYPLSIRYLSANPLLIRLQTSSGDKSNCTIIKKATLPLRESRFFMNIIYLISCEVL